MLVDVDPVTMNIDPEKIAVGPRTKAVIAVHLFGRPCRMEELPDLPVIEDAAGALGARRGGRACGSLGLVRLPQLPSAQDRHHRRGRRGDDDDDRVAAAMAQFRNHGWRSLADADMPAPGLNYRLSDILAAVGLPQMRRLDELLGGREAMAVAYDERLRRPAGDAARGRRGRRPRPAGLRDPGRAARRGAGRAPRPGDRGADRDVRAAAAPRLPDQGFFPGAEHAFEHALALPFHSRLTESDLDRVVEALGGLVS